MNIERTTLLALGFAVGILSSASTAEAQISSPATTLHTWRQTSQGMSSNAALAFYRVRNVGYPNRQQGTGVPIALQNRTLYSAPYYAITRRRGVAATIAPVAPVTAPALGVTTRQTGIVSKPFVNLERPANAVERYWPLLLEAREDRRTGLVIWSLP